MKKTLLLMTALGARRPASFLLSLSALCVLGLSQAKADQLLTWSFTNPDAASSIDGSSLNPHLFDPTLTMSDAITPSASTTVFSGSGWGHNGINLSNAAYFEFTISLVEPGYGLSISSFDLRNNYGGTYSASPDGITLQWAYSIGGGAFTLINPTYGSVGGTSLVKNIDLSSVSALQDVTEDLTFRLYASVSSAAGPADGALGFRNITGQSYGLAVNGTVAPSAVPEPHEWAVLTALMLGGLVWVRIRRRAQLA